MLRSAVPLVAGLVVAGITASLGSWQMSRVDEKREWQSHIEAGMAASPQRFGSETKVEPWMPLLLSGHWLPEGSILLDNRVYEGVVGFHVLTPFELADGRGRVLVNRGWLAAGLRRDQLPVLPSAYPNTLSQPLASTEIVGQVRLPEPKPFTLADSPGEGKLWQYLDVDAYRTWSGLAVQEWVVFQQSDTGDGLVRDWPRPDAGIDRHLGYALQWYSFAVLSLVLTGVYVFRSLKAHVVRHHA